MNHPAWTDAAPTPHRHRHAAARFGGSALPELARPREGVRILLTHACPILRIGIAAILAPQPGLELLDASAGVAQIDDSHIVITDYAAGMQCVRQQASMRRTACPKVLIVTSKDKQWDVRQALEHGVHGYVLQNCIPDELIRSVHLLSCGMAYLSEALSHSVAVTPAADALTRRETEVLHLLARGDADKVIARELGIGLATVKTHVGQVLQKLNATARTHAVVVAIKRGLLPDESDETRPAALL